MKCAIMLLLLVIGASFVIYFITHLVILGIGGLIKGKNIVGKKIGKITKSSLVFSVLNALSAVVMIIIGTLKEGPADLGMVIALIISTMIIVVFTTIFWELVCVIYLIIALIIKKY